MLNIIFWFLEILCAYITCRAIYVVSEKRRVSWCFIVVLMIGFAFTTGGLYRLWNIPIVTILVNIILIYLISLCYEGTWLRRVFLTFMVYALMISGETVAIFVLDYKLPNLMEENGEDINLLVIMVARFFQLSFVLLLEKLWKHQQKKQSTVQIISFIFVMAGSVYIEIVLFAYLYQGFPIFVMTTEIVILLLNFLIVIIYDIFSSMNQKLENNHILQLKSEAYENELKFLEENEKLVHTLRHDMKNHCLAMERQLKDGKINELEGYLNRIIQMITCQKSWIQSGNSAIDSFINYKFQIAENYGISCSVKAKIPEGLEIDSFSMACILGNLLDNAVEASRQVELPQINAQLFYEKRNLYIIIDNKYKGEVVYHEGKIITRKKEKHLHGYGLESVSKELEKCGGTMQIEQIEDIFRVTVMFPAEKECKNDEKNS